MRNRKTDRIAIIADGLFFGLMLFAIIVVAICRYMELFA